MNFFQKTLMMCHRVVKRIRAADEISKFINLPGILSAFIFLILVFFSFHWSNEPGLIPTSHNESESVSGYRIVSTLIEVVDVLLNKPGGYLSNDVIPPSVWLDNIPSWEFGVLVQVRDLSKALRESFSRSQSQSSEDPDLSFAEPRFNVDHLSWAVPWPESEYAEGQEFLTSYMERLNGKRSPAAEFFSRADNLRYWLLTVETRLGSISQRLSSSVGKHRIAGLPDKESSAENVRRHVRTSWLLIDNVFYEARGTAWALVHFLRAVNIDFGDVLEKKKARASLQQIIYELESSLQIVHAPFILNGNGYGIFANHSLVMASYISRANAALIDLRELLSQG